MTGLAELSPRAARTRAMLIAAGLELLVERPIDAIPIDAFVAAAGVAKGSFFNHFVDKQDFANAIASEVRRELEAQIALANAGVTDPLERIAGGMRIAAEFALSHPKQTIVLIRSQGTSTSQTNPLNRGLRDDIDAACKLGLLRPEAKRSGLIYWLGLCQVLMIDLVEQNPAQHESFCRISDMLVLGLTGLGVSSERAIELSSVLATSQPGVGPRE